MIKKIITIIIGIILLNSCEVIGLARYGLEKTANEMREEQEIMEWKKRDGGGAIGVEKYKGEVEETIKNISKRPVNKRIQFGETTLLIPENTIINSKHGNIVDMKTGYGIPISFSKETGCISKKVSNGNYSIVFSSKRELINKIAQKIIKVNGFKNTCN
ncbi:hypothetical protein EII29_11395 [Leptotrichia sp. OH3620_COT-345]|uniref:hypothetical protein n=1 Tax=Leptotrichia sp. OH3620_COT-345 TaxID=2491048 RepID=UPI000F648248|nr:hypothetical protein [Leptotrichia sp. OH3620_COT-345]RRD36923.1 hypothetical protein EII29_11395 [Leptotrichia sp. OH3620_COT-345]